MKEESSKIEVKRPIGITIIAVSAVMIGIAMAFLVPGLLSVADDIAPESQIALIVSVILRVILFISSGVGLLKNKVWGWWLISGYMTFEIIHNISIYFQLPTFGLDLGATSDEIEQAQIKAFGRTITHTLVIFYLFKQNVLTFFHLETRRKDELIAKIFGFTTALFLLLQLI